MTNSKNWEPEFSHFFNQLEQVLQVNVYEIVININFPKQSDWLQDLWKFRTCIVSELVAGSVAQDKRIHFQQTSSRNHERSVERRIRFATYGLVVGLWLSPD